MIRKKVFPFLKNKGLYAGLIFFVLIAVGYYLAHELRNPGYLKIVWDNEIGNRFAGVSQGHDGPVYFYLNELLWQFSYYLYVFPLALYVGLRFAEKKVARMVSFAAVTGLSFLIVISFSGTKLPHYDAPLFPYLALITGPFFYTLYNALKELLNNNTTLRKAGLIAFLSVLLLLAKPYSDIISKVYNPHGDPWEESFSQACQFLQYASQGKVNVNPYKLVFQERYGYGPGTVLRCYDEMIQEAGMQVRYVGRNELMAHDQAVVFDSWTKHLIEQDYDIETLQHLGYCNADIIYIKGKKIKT